MNGPRRVVTTLAVGVGLAALVRYATPAPVCGFAPAMSIGWGASHLPRLVAL
jgi:hypothetical protein